MLGRAARRLGSAAADTIGVRHFSSHGPLYPFFRRLFAELAERLLRCCQCFALLVGLAILARELRLKRTIFFNAPLSINSNVSRPVRGVLEQDRFDEPRGLTK